MSQQAEKSSGPKIMSLGLPPEAKALGYYVEHRGLEYDYLYHRLQIDRDFLLANFLEPGQTVNGATIEEAEKSYLSCLKSEIEQFCSSRPLWEVMHREVTEDKKSGSGDSMWAWTGYRALDHAYELATRGRRLSGIYPTAFEYVSESLTDFLLVKFLPADDGSFKALVRDTRAAIVEKRIFGRPRPTWLGKLSEDDLERPEFWESFGQELSTLNIQSLPFRKYMRHFDPLDSNWAQRIDLNAVTGKYKRIYKYLDQERFVSKQSAVDTAPARALWAEPLYERAPGEIKLQLRALFPRDFLPITLEEAVATCHLPPSMTPILERISLLRPDTQDQLLSSLALFVASNGQLTDQHARFFLDGAIADSRARVQIRDSYTPSEMLSDAETVLAIAKINPELGLQTLFRDEYFSPFLRRNFTRVISEYWNEKNGEVDPRQLQIILLNSWQNAVGPIQQPSQEQANTFLVGEVLNGIGQTAAARATETAKMKHFRSRLLPDGSRTYLYYHQVDGIVDLSDRKGGINADESGLGKTVTEALAAIRLLERRQSERIGSGRVMVVGNKSGIDNWENELSKHIKDIDIVNLTFTTEQQRTGTTLSFKKRLALFGDRVSKTTERIQFLLVNYDALRNPSFLNALPTFGVGVTIVDEVHNVKSGLISAVGSIIAGEPRKKGLAQRTHGLYSFLIDRPDIPVLLATGTPYVKKPAEPLIMAHLTDRDKVPLALVQELQDDLIGTHRLLRNVMIRHRKDELGLLPSFETERLSISLEELGEEDALYFMFKRDQIIDQWGSRNTLGRFYALLNLEAQAKFPWLIDEVQRIAGEERRAIILSPFVRGSNRLTANISTEAIAARLKKEGLSVDRLDGSLSDIERLAVERRFLAGNGPSALVMDYMIGGESRTLCSPDNHATYVIPFIVPPTIARYLNGINRIHRLGQKEPVTVLWPRVIAGHSGLVTYADETYDFQIGQRLDDELIDFRKVVDGQFFIESKDIYQQVARSTTKRRKVYRSPGEEQGLTAERKSLSTVIRESSEKRQTRIHPVFSEGTAEPGLRENLERLFIENVGDYPRGLSEGQIAIVAQYLQSGSSIETLIKDPAFIEACKPGEEERTTTALLASSNIKELVVLSHLWNVYRMAARLDNLGVSFSDLVQEGSIALMVVTDRLSSSRIENFSAYLGAALYKRMADVNRTTERKTRRKSSISLDTNKSGTRVKDSLALSDNIPDIAFREALAQLDQRDQDLLSFRFEKRMKGQEIAIKLGFPSVGAVYIAMHRAKQKLRSAISIYNIINKV